MPLLFSGHLLRSANVRMERWYAGLEERTGVPHMESRPSLGGIYQLYSLLW